MRTRLHRKNGPYRGVIFLVIVGLSLCNACSWRRSQQVSSFATPEPVVRVTPGHDAPAVSATNLPFPGSISPTAEDGNDRTAGPQTVGLFDIFETQVVNPSSYANPFDYREIELQGTFSAPSGKQVRFFGFYDGDGNGGQSGSVWKLRFMPDEMGTWSYQYTWTDGTPGGGGSFEVVDTGLPGPLQVAQDNPWYFMDGRSRPFHWRGYDMHVTARYSPHGSILEDVDWLGNLVQERVVAQGFNFTMWDGLINRSSLREPNLWKESWWEDSTRTERFNIPAWYAWEEALSLAKERHVYVTTFAGMVSQGDEYDFSSFQIFLKYWVARFGPFFNFLGWSPTWEWTDIWSPDEVDQIMGYVDEINPFPTLLSVHDCSHTSFSGWLSFSMRQAQSQTVFDGNSRTAGQQQGVCDGPGGVGQPFLDQPIIGSEDIWETESGKWGQPRNETEVRRGAWGIMLAGVLPLYSEWHPNPPPEGGKGRAVSEVVRMFDFVYANTRYREYRQLNELVASTGRQIASGVPGEEYLIYTQDGGQTVIDLSATSTSAAFSILWLDPVTGTQYTGGTIQGGAQVNLTAPFSGDSVLLLVLRR